MRKHFLLVATLFLLACIAVMYRRCRPAPFLRNEVRDTVTVFQTDTFIKTDTIRKYYPKPYEVRIIDTLYIRDTVFIREQKEYKDSIYTAWVSGYDARLDSIKIYPRTKVIINTIYRDITVTKKKPWGIGVQFGVGYPRGFYAGIGISYDLYSW